MNKFKFSIANERLFLLFPLTIYLFFAFVLLTKDPVIFPDEVYFGSIGYNIAELNSFNAQQYAQHFPAVSINDLVYHGPLYYLVLAASYRLFGFSIYSTRFASVIIGLFAIIAAYKLSRSFINNYAISLLVATLLSVDYFFLRSARMGRPDILALLLLLIALVYYRKSLHNPSFVNYFATFMSVALGILTHYYLGLISLITISLQFLFSYKNNKRQINRSGLIKASLIPLLIVFAWLFVIIVVFPSAINQSAALGIQRITPTFYSISSIIRGDVFIKSIFLLYSISVAYLFISKRTSIKMQLIITFSVVIIVVFIGGLDWYLSILTIPIYLAIGYAVFNYCKKKVALNIVSCLVALLFFLNIAEQFRLMKHYGSYSYDRYCAEIEKNLPQGAKVMLTKIIPDAFFCFTNSRQDLKLSYEYDANSTDSSLEEAEYILTYDSYLQLLKLKGSHSKDNNSAISINSIILTSGMNKAVLDKLQTEGYEATVLSGSAYFPALAIFKLGD